MEKKIYEKPMMQLEDFIPNECVASCTKEVYDFTCDAKAGIIHYYNDFPANIDRPTQQQIDERTVTITNRNRYYTPCSEGKHDVPREDLSQFYHGFVDRNGNHHEDANEGAIIWLQPLYDRWGRLSGYNGHATNKLSISEIPIVKS